MLGDVQESRSKQSFGGGSLIFWGAIQGDQKVSLVEVKGHMDALAYQKVLEGNMLPYIRNFVDLRLQQDNAPPHANKSTRNWLASKNVSVEEWPSLHLTCPPLKAVGTFSAESLWAWQAHTQKRF